MGRPMSDNPDILETVKYLLVNSGILFMGIRNPANDWNLESGIWNQISIDMESRIQSSTDKASEINFLEYNPGYCLRAHSGSRNNFNLK